MLLTNQKQIGASLDRLRRTFFLVVRHIMDTHENFDFEKLEELSQELMVFEQDSENLDKAMYIFLGQEVPEEVEPQEAKEEYEEGEPPPAKLPEEAVIFGG